CPTLRVPSARRHRATTSWLVQPSGLSTSKTPFTTSFIPFSLLCRGAAPSQYGGTVAIRRHPRITAAPSQYTVGVIPRANHEDSIAAAIVAWFQRAARDLPWREADT